MRTTLDIDARVLAAARARVNEGLSKSIGDAVSELALAALNAEEVLATANRETSGGLVLLPSAPEHVITDRMVAEALLDE